MQGPTRWRFALHVGSFCGRDKRGPNLERPARAFGNSSAAEFTVLILLLKSDLAINALVDAQGSFAELKLLGIQSIRLAGALEFAAAALNISSGTVSCLNVATSQVQHDSFGEVFWTDLAVSPDGS